MCRNRIVLLILFFFFIMQFCFIQSVKAEQNELLIDLQTELAEYIKPYQGKITLRYQNLVTSETYSLNSQTEVPAASTIKLPLALFVMKLADQGELDLNEQLTYQSRHYYGGSGIIQNDKVGTSFTVDELVEKAMVYSDNIAFIMLKERVGPEPFIGFIKSLGAEFAYPGGRNTTSADDLNLYAGELYRYSKQSPNGEKLVQFLEHTIYNTTIPQGIKDKPVAHKVGMIPKDLIYNDTALIFDYEPYTLAITTKGIAYEKSQQVIAEIASIVNSHHQLIAEERRKDLAITVDYKQLSVIPTISLEKGSFFHGFLEKKMFGKFFKPVRNNWDYGGNSYYQQLLAVQGVSITGLTASMATNN